MGSRAYGASPKSRPHATAQTPHALASGRRTPKLPYFEPSRLTVFLQSRKANGAAGALRFGAAQAFVQLRGLTSYRRPSEVIFDALATGVAHSASQRRIRA